MEASAATQVLPNYVRYIYVACSTPALHIVYFLERLSTLLGGGWNGIFFRDASVLIIHVALKYVFVS